jgi:hypothetical protein
MYTTVGQLVGSDLSQNLNSLLPSPPSRTHSETKKAAAPAFTRHQRPLLIIISLCESRHISRDDAPKVGASRRRRNENIKNLLHKHLTAEGAE